MIINKGDFIGIQGESGSGKTTLIDIILGIYTPASGKVLFNGVDIKEDIASWRSNIAYLPQDTFLIEGTVAENIAIGESEANENEIIDALKKAELLHHIDSLENGIHSKIGDAGLLLSGGQKQRLYWQEHSIRTQKYLYLMNQLVHLMLFQKKRF